MLSDIHRGHGPKEEVVIDHLDPSVQQHAVTMRRLWELDLAAALLDKAAAAQPHDLARSEEHARDAFAVAEPIVNDRWVGRANEMKARACVLVGNVRRLEGEHDGAEEMFRKAVFHLTGPPDCRERAFYCRHLALLRQDRGQLDEAAGLLWRAASIYREKGELREEGLCTAQLGLLLLEEEQVERAVPPLVHACAGLGLPADAALRARCGLALAYCHGSLGALQESRRCLEWAQSLGSQLSGDEPAAHRAWYEGKVAALADGAEGLEEAAGLLDAARKGFLSAGDLNAAAQVSIDLGLVWIRSGRRERVADLMDELARALRPDPGKVGVLFALGPIVESARLGTDLKQAAASARSRLRCCRRDPVLALGYWPPDLSGTVPRSGDRLDPSMGPVPAASRIRRFFT